MKVIDLLNKIANGEEVPKKIKFRSTIYELDETETTYYNAEDITFMQYYNFKILNDEVEILEEEPRDIEVCGSLFTKSEYDNLFRCKGEKKIPEKLTDILRIEDLVPPVDENMYKIWKQTINNHNKINEIIDYLGSKGE